MTRRTATDPLDAAARRAFRAACDRVGGWQPYSDFFQLSARTAQRLYAMQTAVPPGLAAQVADAIKADRRASAADTEHEIALRAWADRCRQESAHG